MSVAGLRSLKRWCFGVLIVLFAAGCGGGGTDDNVVVIWEQRDPAEREIFMEHVEAYRQAHPEVEIQVSHYGVEDLRTQFQTAAMAGSGPDLVYGPSDPVGPFSVMGLIHAVDEILEPSKLTEFIPESFDTLDGRIYSLPDQMGNHLTLVWNTDLLERAPETMDEFLSMAKDATIDENGDGVPDQYGLVFEVMEPFWTIPFLTGYGGWVMDESGAPTLDTPAMVNALEFIRSLKTEHGVMPVECDYNLSDTIFKEGRAAMIINGPWSWKEYREAGVPIALTRIPLVSVTGRGPGPMISTRGYSINRRVSREKLPLVLQVLDELVSVENQIDFALRLGALPVRKAAYDDPRVKDDPVLAASYAQVRVGRRMPVVPEMRAIWDVKRPGVQSVWNGTRSPEEAARQMQITAIEKIAEMKR